MLSGFLMILCICIYIYIYVQIHVIFKNRAGVLDRDLKHEPSVLNPDKTHTASFLDVFLNEPPNKLIHVESLEIHVF